MVYTTAYHIKLIEMKKILLSLLLVFMITTLHSQTTRSADEAKGLAIGAIAPIFTSIDANNETFVLKEALAHGPVVLIFYRGVWCPYCSKHLSMIQDSLQMIEDKGARVIAISPQKPEYLAEMKEKSGAEFTVLYDEGFHIADAYDVSFTPTSRKRATYNLALGAKLKESQSDDSQRFPIPATYLIDPNGVIAWRQFDPNYKNRSTVKEILTALDWVSGTKK